MNEAGSGLGNVAGLVDIVEPIAPVAAAAGNWPWLAAAFAVVALLIIVLLMLLKKKWPAYRAVKRLRKLRQQTLAGELTPHESIYLLALELRRGLRLDRLFAENTPASFNESDRALWSGFVKQLDALRYQSGEGLTDAKLEPIVTQIELWLRRYCR